MLQKSFSSKALCAVSSIIFFGQSSAFAAVCTRSSGGETLCSHSVIDGRILNHPDPSSYQKLPECQPENLEIKMTALKKEDKNQAGVEISVRNLSEQACSIAGRLGVELGKTPEDRSKIKRHVPRGFHPGPVIFPRRLEKNDVATMEVTWAQAGEERCLKPRIISIPFLRLEHKLKGKICGPKNSPIEYDQSNLHVKGKPPVF